MYVIVELGLKLDDKPFYLAYEIPRQYINSPAWAEWFVANYVQGGRVLTANGRPVLAATPTEAERRHGAALVPIGDTDGGEPYWGLKDRRSFEKWARSAQARQPRSGRMRQLQQRAARNPLIDRRSGFHELHIPQRAWGGAPPMLTHPGSQGYRIPPQATGGIPAQLNHPGNQGWEKIKRIGRQGHRQY